MQTPPPDSPDPHRSGGDVAGFWDRYTGRSSGGGDTGQSSGAEDEQAPESTDRSREPGEGAADEAPSTGQGEPADRPPRHHHHADGHECLDWCPICRGAEMLRAAVPPELQAQFQLVQRDALLMAQAMIAAQLERMRAQQGQAASPSGDDPGVESIPLD